MPRLFIALLCALVFAGCSNIDAIKKAGEKVTKTVSICTETNSVQTLKNTSTYSQFAEPVAEQELAAPNMMFSWDTKMVTW